LRDAESFSHRLVWLAQEAAGGRLLLSLCALMRGEQTVNQMLMTRYGAAALV
jgi:hypothetical protein